MRLTSKKYGFEEYIQQAALDAGFNKKQANSFVEEY